MPAELQVFAEWRIRRLGLDYHVDVERHYYSVLHRFAKEQVDARLTARTVEIFVKGERVAAHIRGSGNGKHTTVHEHMPSSHRRIAGWTIERIRRDTAIIGASFAALCELILEERLQSLGPARVEAACARALEIGARTFGSVKPILENNLDRLAALKQAEDAVASKSELPGF